jgi:hypothetical protein
VPSFHALGSCTENSQHCVLKKRRSTSQYLDALTKPMLPPVSLDLRHQRRNVLAAPRCQQTSLAGNHFRGNSVISSWRLELARGLRQASLVQVRCQSRDDNFITPRPQLYTLSVGCTVSTRQAEQKHYALTSARGLQIRVVSPPPVASGVHCRYAIRFDQQALASQGTPGVGRLRAPEANICQRCFSIDSSPRDCSRSSENS